MHGYLYAVDLGTAFWGIISRCSRLNICCFWECSVLIIPHFLRSFQGWLYAAFWGISSRCSRLIICCFCWLYSTLQGWLYAAFLGISSRYSRLIICFFWGCEVLSRLIICCFFVDHLKMFIADYISLFEALSRLIICHFLLGVQVDGEKLHANVQWESVRLEGLKGCWSL